MAYVYEFSGLTPSKKNSRVTVKATGRSFPSKKYTEWHKQKTMELSSQPMPSVPIANCTVEIALRFETLGIADMTNKAESIMDLLVDLGILHDDNWRVVPRLVLTASLDRKNPGATVTVTEISDNNQLL
jgi:hypothetical protein